MLLLDAVATPVVWVALLLPVLDAGVAFGAPAAGVVWGILSLVYIVLKLELPGSDGSTPDVLRLALEQLTAVAAVALPTTYVAGRLRDNLDEAQGARSAAHRHTWDLLIVATAARRLSETTDPAVVLEIALESSASFGFARSRYARSSTSGRGASCVPSAPG